MADLAASDVTVVVEFKERYNKRRHNRVKLTFGNGTLTYPAGGVPIPAAGLFGMKRNIDYLILSDPGSTVGLIWKYDQTNKKLRAYVQGFAHGTAGAVTMDDYPVTAGDGVTTAASVSLASGLGAATDRLGGLVELSGGASTVSAQTLFAEAVGA